MLGTGGRAGVQKDIASIPVIPDEDTGRSGRKRKSQKTAGSLERREGGSCDLSQPRIKKAGVPPPRSQG